MHLLALISLRRSLSQKTFSLSLFGERPKKFDVSCFPRSKTAEPARKGDLDRPLRYCKIFLVLASSLMWEIFYSND